MELMTKEFDFKEVTVTSSLVESPSMVEKEESNLVDDRERTQVDPQKPPAVSIEDDL